MAVITGTIASVNLKSFPAADDITGALQRLTAELFVTFGAATSGDTLLIPTVASTVQNKLRDGRTLTLRGGVCAGPGRNTADGALYAGTVAVSGTGLTASPSDASGSATGASATVKPIQFLAVLDATLP